jgi:DNA invertase Pin-like site-specific DNA recombinase
VEVLKHLRKGDTLVVTKLDRLARSMRDLLRIVDLIQGKKAALRILGTDIDTGTPTGKLMLNLLGSFAEFERQIMLERQRAGIARAKAEGKFKGRKPTARAKSEAIMQLHGQGVAGGRLRTAWRLAGLPYIASLRTPALIRKASARSVALPCTEAHRTLRTAQNCAERIKGAPSIAPFLFARAAASHR